MPRSNGFAFFRRFLFGILAIAILAPTLYYLYYSFLIHKFTVVSEGKVYRSAEMPPKKIKSIIKAYNLRTIIDLRRQGKKTKAEQTAVVNTGAQYINLHSHQIPTDEVIEDFLTIMGRPESYPVIIHCEHGEGRAPLFSAIYLIEFECWSNEEALQSPRSILKLGGFSLDDKKGRFLNRYKPRLDNCKTKNNDIYSMSTSDQ